MPRSDGKAAALLFLAVFSVVFAFHFNRVVATNDEGIVLDAAERMLSGARPYADFFGYMSPGSYWLQAFVFRIFGVALWSGRLIVVFDFALQCALLYWLVAKLGSRRAAWTVTAIFFGFQLADPSFLTAQHRWDSATLALAGLCVAVGASRSAHWIASGALFAAAAWCTPAMALIGAVVGVFLWIRDRARVLPFGIGIAGVTAAAAGALASSGSLAPFVNQVFWLQQNYSALNFMPYGAIIGGYRALFDGASGVEVAMRGVLVACVALPAIMPVLALALSSIALRKAEDQASLLLLMAVVVALAASTYPRSDVEHLAFVAAVPYALAAIACARVVPARVAAISGTAAIVFACVFASNFFNTWRDTKPVASAVGMLRVPKADADSMSSLFAEVHPGGGLFVYPYMPVVYFLTQAANPTRFSFLNQGMMTRQDSLRALDELRAKPPARILYLKMSKEELLRVFPHGANLDWHYQELEGWLNANYGPREPGIAVWGYRLYERRTASPPPESSRAAY